MAEYAELKQIVEGIQRDLQGLATTEKIDELIRKLGEKDKTIEELKERWWP